MWTLTRLAPALVGAVTLCFGCSLDRQAAGAEGSTDGGRAVERDAASSGSDAAVDASPAPDAHIPDGSGGPEDAGPSRSTCPAPDEHTLALYPFDGDVGTRDLTDVSGAHVASLSAGDVTWIDGPDGCGQAIRFGETASEAAFGRIDDSPNWDLAEGSIDLWIQLTELPAGPVGVLSRDARDMEMPGHFGIGLSTTGRLAIRIQREMGLHQCTDGPLPLGEWVHVGVNFGAPEVELWVNGVRERSDTPLAIPGFLGSTPVPCNDSGTYGIDGNDNPIGLGISFAASEEGTGAPAAQPFLGGAMDHVRISSARRDFSVFASN